LEKLKSVYETRLKRVMEKYNELLGVNYKETNIKYDTFNLNPLLEYGEHINFNHKHDGFDTRFNEVDDLQRSYYEEANKNKDDHDYSQMIYLFADSLGSGDDQKERVASSISGKIYPFRVSGDFGNFSEFKFKESDNDHFIVDNDSKKLLKNLFYEGRTPQYCQIPGPGKLGFKGSIGYLNANDYLKKQLIDADYTHNTVALKYSEFLKQVKLDKVEINDKVVKFDKFDIMKSQNLGILDVKYDDSSKKITVTDSSASEDIHGLIANYKDTYIFVADRGNSDIYYCDYSDEYPLEYKFNGDDNDNVLKSKYNKNTIVFVDKKIESFTETVTRYIKFLEKMASGGYKSGTIGVDQTDTSDWALTSNNMMCENHIVSCKHPELVRNVFKKVDPGDSGMVLFELLNERFNPKNIYMSFEFTLVMLYKTFFEKHGKGYSKIFSRFTDVAKSLTSQTRVVDNIAKFNTPHEFGPENPFSDKIIGLYKAIILGESNKIKYLEDDITLLPQSYVDDIRDYIPWFLFNLKYYIQTAFIHSEYLSEDKYYGCNYDGTVPDHMHHHRYPPHMHHHRYPPHMHHHRYPPYNLLPRMAPL
jgi:hypothetical protein